MIHELAFFKKPSSFLKFAIKPNLEYNITRVAKKGPYYRLSDQSGDLLLETMPVPHLTGPEEGIYICIWSIKYYTFQTPMNNQQICQIPH